jgi:hypothetical protein
VAGKLEEPLENAARATAQRVVFNGGTPLQAGRPQLSEAALDATLEHGIVPMGSTAGTAERMSNARAILGDQYGRIVKALEEKGITGPDADALIEQYASAGVSANANTMNRAVPAVYEEAATQVGNKPTVRGKLGLTQTENMKRSAQDMAKSSYQKLDPSEVGRRTRT